ncbi:MAG: hypoxanthine phosphoribosyltransferase [Fibrobacter sp.]|nr:hypoxanthine phosphoribosyltransferase [Fibrobacter sp.]
MYRMSRQPLISKKEIDERLDTLAEELRSENFDIVVSTLLGGFIFTADICRRIAKPELKVAFIKASSYGDGTESSGKVKISGLESLNIAGKNILVIDDILDTGNTMLGITNALRDMGPNKVKTCVLLNKQARRTADIRADFVGFEVENKFIVGCGLDYAGDYRTLPEIWTLEEADG